MGRIVLRFVCGAMHLFCFFGVGVLGGGGGEETGIDEVVAVYWEVGYGAGDGLGGTELAEVGVGVSGGGAACGRDRGVCVVDG